jgi:CubicO group peptidase (beta-lactamase class C family)
VVTEDDGSQRPLKKGAYGWSGAYGTHFWCDPVREICVVYLSNMTTAGGSGALTARHIERDIMESIIQTRYHGVNNTIENIYRQR